MREILQTVIREQHKLFAERLEVVRQIPTEYISCSEVLVISGIRRCGKSVLLHQIRRNQKEKDYYLNFDDERLIDFRTEHFQELHEVFMALYGNQSTFYFDEIQNVTGWERFVRRLYDSGNKVFVTGSNASMLSRELGTHLTGRYVQFELYPFSFSEFLRFKKQEVIKISGLTTAEKGAMYAFIEQYMNAGGFPGYLRSKYDDYLKSLYESVIYRDVLVRNKLTNEKELLQLVYFLASNVAKPYSHISLAKVIGVKNVSTVKSYIEYLENSYLLFSVYKFDYSLKAQYLNPKKVYFIDNALVDKLGFRMSPDVGRKLENLVYIELRRRGKEVFYHQGKHECDFIVRDGYHISEAIQVCYLLNDENTLERELAGLREAMNTYGLQEGLLLTGGKELKLSEENKSIRIIPVWKWLLKK